MKVLKFGGTSLANAKKFLLVANILKENTNKEKIAVVLSAPAKITNYLVKSIEKIDSKKQILENISAAENIFFQLIHDIKILHSTFNFSKIETIISLEFNKLKELINGILILKQCPKNIRAIIISRGEILSVFIMKYLLQTYNFKIKILDPVKKFVSNGLYLDSKVDINQSQDKIKDIDINKFDIILMAGFIAGNQKEELVLLGRNGSDYSAAILSACLHASCCEIWTDVDGVFTSDPKEVPNAHLLKEISYEEAMELSYFGAKVLHPRTIQPLFKFNIPCFIKNTNNITSPGTLICNKNNIENDSLKGVTYLNKVVMLSISGKNAQKILNIISRLFNIMSHENIKIILITQSSSNNNINFCILEKDMNKSEYIFKKEFQLELKEKIINPIHFIKKLSIISIIGSNIYKKNNIASKIFSVLGMFKINVCAIAQGSSKNSMSFVINEKNTLNGVKIIHNILFSDTKIITALIIGIGGVGSTLINQIINQKIYLKKNNIKIKVCIIANSKKILFLKNGINIKTWKNDFKLSQQKYDLNILKNLISQHHFINPVVIDCTSDQQLSEQYINFFNHGCHVITSNKKANTNNLKYYQNIRKTSVKNHTKFLYETNVGAGLPVISTLQNLLKTGDNIIKFTGILSGSLSFIFGKLEEGLVLSEATAEAKSLGFTEPHPYDDLSGIDVARKLLILAREIGYEIELKDIIVEPILPKKFLQYKNIDQFILQLKKIDYQFIERVNKAKQSGKVLRFVGSIKNEGKCTVKIKEIDKKNPLYTVKNGENVLAFYSKNYQPIPLVLRGYGAGNDVTASGVFSDLLRTIL